jgi:hypothetical protein
MSRDVTCHCGTIFHVQSPLVPSQRSSRPVVVASRPNSVTPTTKTPEALIRARGRVLEGHNTADTQLPTYPSYPATLVRRTPTTPTAVKIVSQRLVAIDPYGDMLS